MAQPIVGEDGFVSETRELVEEIHAIVFGNECREVDREDLQFVLDMIESRGRVIEGLLKRLNR